MIDLTEACRRRLADLMFTATIALSLDDGHEMEAVALEIEEAWMACAAWVTDKGSAALDVLDEDLQVVSSLLHHLRFLAQRKVNDG
jgi:hypothetical protein